MSLPVTASLLAEDVSLIEASEFWQRQRLDIVQTSVGKVFVKAQRKGRHPFRYNLLNAIAFLVRMPMIKAASAPDGQASQAIEVRRLQSLRDAGVQVPAVLHAAPQWFAMQFVDAPNLLDCMQREQRQLERLNLWLQGAEGIGHVHRNGLALSQAFAHNCLLHERQIWFIDFEDDPTQVMSLSHAQARDWLAYLHSTVWALRQCGVSWEEMLSKYERFTQYPSQPVAKIIKKMSVRIAWLRHFPNRRKPWGRDVAMLQALGEFFYQIQQSKKSEES